MNRRYFLSIGCAAAGAAMIAGLSTGYPRINGRDLQQNSKPQAGTKASKGITKVTKTNDEWKKELTREQYYVTREKGTERPFSSPLNEVHEDGVFECVACGLPLYDAKAKFDSGTGWPSFYEPIAPENVREETDNSLFATRTEVLCSRCDAHLGHVFNDGPKPTGLRYCMNGVALKFVNRKS
ncbi:MAG: peptide-methionine (R)-S-oxide reductase MsrB [Acidobacteriota bacterium]|nr:peptide-methionine (R)-S-oxide reductase MsrB [Acidobacteriota bacterium]